MKTIIKSNRTFGVEIEFASQVNQTEIASRLKRKFRSIEFEGENWNTTTRNYFKVITDSSIDSRGGYGLELVTPILKGKKGLNDLRKVLDVLNSFEDVSVNKSCGIHVHVDVNDADINGIGRVLKLYSKQSKFIDRILAPSRRVDGSKGKRWAMNLEYASRSNDSREFFNKIDNSINSVIQDHYTMNDRVTCLKDLFRNNPSGVNSRYCAVNLDAYRKYGTVEFRQHHASTDSEKISNWVVFVTNLVDRAIKAKKVFVGETTFERTFKASRQLLKFASNRAVGFGFEEHRLEENIVRVAGKDLAEGIELVKLSNGAFQLFANGNLLDNTMSHFKQFAEQLGIDFTGMNTRRLGQALLSA